MRQEERQRDQAAEQGVGVQQVEEAAHVFDVPVLLGQWNAANDVGEGHAPQQRGDETADGDGNVPARAPGKVGTGLFFRSAVEPGKRILGWQLDIGAGLDGGLYKEGPQGGKISYPAPAKALATAQAAYMDALAMALATASAGGTASWPSATITINQ